MKEKFLDILEDGEIIKQTQLSFLLEGNTTVAVSGDVRTAGLEDKNQKQVPQEKDPREAMLWNLIRMA